MIRTILFSFISIAFISCGNSASNESSSASTTVPNDPKVQEGLELVASSDCFSCHKVSDRMVGPAYKMIADKYPNTDENRKNLAQKIIKGSSGNWGTLPMSPHPNISTADAEKMVHYILSVQ